MLLRLLLLCCLQRLAGVMEQQLFASKLFVVQNCLSFLYTSVQQQYDPALGLCAPQPAAAKFDV